MENLKKKIANIKLVNFIIIGCQQLFFINHLSIIKK
jgi:hypothetical protein